MSDSFLNELTQSKSKLKPTETRISHVSGRTFIKPSGSNEEREVAEMESEESGNRESNVMYWSRKLGYLVDLLPDLSMDEIIPRLYLSADDVATNRELLRAKSITHVLNVTTNVENRFESEIVYKKIVLYDLPSQPISRFFDESFEFIDGALNDANNSVLVHCNAGVSRSASLVIAYLMKKRVYGTFREAHDAVKSKRSKISPNEGFRKALLDLEKNLNNTTSTDQL